MWHCAKSIPSTSNCIPGHNSNQIPSTPNQHGGRDSGVVESFWDQVTLSRRINWDATLHFKWLIMQVPFLHLYLPELSILFRLLKLGGTGSHHHPPSNRRPYWSHLTKIQLPVWRVQKERKRMGKRPEYNVKRTNAYKFGYFFPFLGG